MIRWIRSHGVTLMAFATLACSTATAVFVADLWSKFDIKSQSLARKGSESAENMGVATTVLGSWILPAVVVVTVLSLATFVVTLRRHKPTPA